MVHDLDIIDQCKVRPELTVYGSQFTVNSSSSRFTIHDSDILNESKERPEITVHGTQFTVHDS